MTESDLKDTPLSALHRERGAKLVAFAGYRMPLQYPAGIIAEHLQTRASAALFDVSHMGQVRLAGDDVVAALEALVPSDLAGLADGAIRYTLLTNEDGGILDDLMVARDGGDLMLVVNAARKDADLAHLRERLDGRGEVTVLDDLALLALQGPKAVEVLARLVPGCRDLGFMTWRTLDLDGIACRVARSGYSGEDGFEISVAGAAAEALARRLLAEPEVAPAGLGARDSLRLEAGLCLYGHDIDETTTPVEAGLAWVIQKRRRAEGGFPGARIVLEQLERGARRRRVGVRPQGRVPVREGAALSDPQGAPLGRVTSGGYGPSVGGPVAMGYVAADHAAPGGQLSAEVRGRQVPCRVAKLPFVPHNYHRG